MPSQASPSTIANLAREPMAAGLASYFEYEREVARQVAIPWLEQRIPLRNKTVGDFGCHEGGVLEALQDVEVAEAIGIDYNLDAIQASPLAGNTNKKIRLEHANILHITPEQYQFDLVLFRDVLEHIPNHTEALCKACECLAPGGYIFASFPPYYSPFGGHQHESANWVRWFPFIHYLPEAIFKRIVRVEDSVYMTAQDCLNDINSVRSTKLTLTKFEKAVKAAGLKIADRDLFLLRPEFKLRFGIESLRFPRSLQNLWLREMFVMGAIYLLKRAS